MDTKRDDGCHARRVYTAGFQTVLLESPICRIIAVHPCAPVSASAPRSLTDRTTVVREVLAVILKLRDFPRKKNE